MSRAQALVARRAPEAENAVRTADVFCRHARRRAAALFRDLWSNDDVVRYRHGVSVLDGESLWLEAGILEHHAAPVRPRERKEKVPVAV